MPASRAGERYRYAAILSDSRAGFKDHIIDKIVFIHNIQACALVGFT